MKSSYLLSKFFKSRKLIISKQFVNSPQISSQSLEQSLSSQELCQSQRVTTRNANFQFQSKGITTQINKLLDDYSEEKKQYSMLYNDYQLINSKELVQNQRHSVQKFSKFLLQEKLEMIQNRSKDELIKRVINSSNIRRQLKSAKSNNSLNCQQCQCSLKAKIIHNNKQQLSSIRNKISMDESSNNTQSKILSNQSTFASICDSKIESSKKKEESITPYYLTTKISQQQISTQNTTPKTNQNQTSLQGKTFRTAISLPEEAKPAKIFKMKIIVKNQENHQNKSEVLALENDKKLSNAQNVEFIDPLPWELFNSEKEKISLQQSEDQNAEQLYQFNRILQRRIAIQKRKQQQQK